MKPISKNLSLAYAFVVAASLAISPALYAEEAEVEPEIVICEGHPDGAIIDEEIELDTEIVVEDESSDTEEVTDEVVETSTDEVIEDGEEPKIIVCWEEGWFYRPDVEDESGNPEVHYMSVVRPNAENQRADDTNAAPEASHEQSAVTVVEAKTVTTKIQRAVTKPSAVKSQGRVFLR